MMTNNADNFWKKQAQELRRDKGLSALTPEDAQMIFEQLTDEPLAKGELEKIVDSVLSGEMQHWTPSPDVVSASTPSTSEVEEDILQLNRNAGESDAETDDLLERLRREALEDVDGKDENGLDGNPESPGKSG